MPMAEFRVDLRPRPTGEHLERVRRLLASMGEDDVIHLVAERQDSHQLDAFVRLFAQHGLGVQPKGGHRDGYHLYASRHLPRPAPRTGPYAED
jgi:hypothetical protein